MNDYKGVRFTITARHDDRAKITEAIQAQYPEVAVEFIEADVAIPTATVFIPDGHRITAMRQEVSPGQFRDISGEVITASVNSLLLSLFPDRVA